MELKHADFDRLRFGQVHARSAPWFERNGVRTHAVSIDEFPQSRFLARDENGFDEYMVLSWPYYGRSSRPDERQAHAEWYREYVRNMWKSRSDIADVEPVPVAEHPDGRLIVIDGNHRVAAAHHHELGLPITVTSTERWLRQITLNRGEFYGSKHRGMPYQSVMLDGVELLQGRRADMASRHELLDPADLADKRVLDVGCNLGAQTFLAAETAAEAVGIDVSEKIVTSALRLGAFLDSPARFQVADATSADLGRFDTMLLFSVSAHAGTAGLVGTIQRAKPSVVYVEAHDGWTWASHRELHSAFVSVEAITGGDRDIWRCET